MLRRLSKHKVWPRIDSRVPGPNTYDTNTLWRKTMGSDHQSNQLQPWHHISFIGTRTTSTEIVQCCYWFRWILIQRTLSFKTEWIEQKYADWNKISDPASKTDEELFNELYDSISTKLGKPDSMEYLEAKFQEIPTISPFSLKVRILYNDFLLDQIADVIDLNFAHKAVENIQTILDKFGNKIELDKRLALHHELAVIQLFILNTQPQVSLRKCLNLDMDYQPCKDLMRVWNQISKVLP